MVSEVKAKVIPLYLITGFLGSGKTTLLKNILARYSDKKRIAVIQNEFAAKGIDGIELKLTGSGFKLVEINNGSVFCVCRMANFVESVQNMVEEYRPEMIFLEASGLADPINIIELLGREGLNGRVGLANVITIVDAPNFEKGRKTLTRFRHQIMIADTVLINKSDIFDGNNSRLQMQVRDINPFARIIDTTYCKTDLKDLISNGEEILKFNTSCLKYPAKYNNASNFPGNMRRAAAAYTGRKPEGRPDINACVLRAHEKLTLEGLRLFVKELQDLSSRVKGFINLKNGNVMAVQTVFEHCVISQVRGYDGPSELIAFGRELTPRYLRDLLRKHSS